MLDARAGNGIMNMLLSQYSMQNRKTCMAERLLLQKDMSGLFHIPGVVRYGVQVKTPSGGPRVGAAAPPKGLTHLLLLTSPVLLCFSSSSLNNRILASNCTLKKRIFIIPALVGK